MLGNGKGERGEVARGVKGVREEGSSLVDINKWFGQVLIVVLQQEEVCGAARVQAVPMALGITVCCSFPAHGLEHPHLLPGAVGRAQPWFVNTRVLFMIASPVPKPNTGLLRASRAATVQSNVIY